MRNPRLSYYTTYCRSFNYNLSSNHDSSRVLHNVAKSNSNLRLVCCVPIHLWSVFIL